jgi:uncharacterized protein (TIGR00288 family)
MARSRATESQQQLAVFIDFENIALGLQNSPRFQVRRVLDRLLEKGKVIAKVAYADWNRFREYTRDLHENGIELIEIPRRATSGKNSADIRLVVDAMDLSWSKEHIDTFVIVSGDSDFSPLVAKLKENGRHVIGLGMKASTSPLLANGCDEFIYYEDLEHEAEQEQSTESDEGESRSRARSPRDKDSAFRLLADTVRALERENFDVIQASLVKDTMKRKRPAFSEAALGYSSFSEMLEDAQEAGIVTLRRDERSGTYDVKLAAGVVGGRKRRAPTGAAGARSGAAPAHSGPSVPTRTALPLADLPAAPRRAPGSPAPGSRRAPASGLPNPPQPSATRPAPTSTIVPPVESPAANGRRGRRRSRAGVRSGVRRIRSSV